MLNPDPQTLSDLIRLLRPLMGSARERQAILIESFRLDSALHDQIDCSGSTGTFLPRLLRKLVEFGEVSEGEQALVLLLKTAQKMVGREQQGKIAELIYQLEYHAGGSQTDLAANQGSKYQDLSAVTVGIRNPYGNLVGAGLIINSRVVTLGRVVSTADPQQLGRIHVYLPRAYRRGNRQQEAAIESIFPNRTCGMQDDDIVILKLSNGVLNDKTTHVENSDQSVGNPFRIYGYTGLPDRPSDYLDGEIVGPLDPPPVEIDSRISCLKLSPEDKLFLSMAGSGVLDLRRNLVVGIVSRPRLSDTGALAFCGSIISLDPIRSVLSSLDA